MKPLLAGPLEAAVYVVIPVRNRLALTRSCLSSLATQTLRHVVVVVDDGSSDGTPEMVRAEFPDAVLLRGDGDLWWSAATNMGVAWVLHHCEQDALLVTLNDDTVFKPDYLRNLVRPIRPESRMLLGSIAVSYRDPSVIVDGGVHVQWRSAKFVDTHRGMRVEEAFASAELEDVDVLCGCGTLIPARAFRELGPYDARCLPHYGADYEFSRRAARAGYRLAVNPAAVLAIHEDETGIHSRVSQEGLGSLLRSFTSRRSATNLRMRWHFARLAAPRKTLALYAVCDLGRVLLGSLRRCVTHRAG